MTAQHCPGSGWARTCEEKDGLKVHLLEHMKTLWAKIGFQPSSFNMDGNLEDDEMPRTVNIKENNFTPTHKKNKLDNLEMEKFTGVVVGNFPKEIPETAVSSFLEEKGMPMGWKDIKIIRKHKNTCVEIENLEPQACKSIISEVDNKPFFDRKLYCSGMSNVISPVKPSDVTVEKPKITVNENPIKEKEPAKKSQTPSKKSIPGLPEEELLKGKKKKGRKPKHAEKPEIKSKHLTVSDFLPASSNIDQLFDFSDNRSEDGAKGFFQRSPMDALTPTSPNPRSAKLSQKEEMWNMSVEQQRKRPSSPQEDFRRIRSRSSSELNL